MMKNATPTSWIAMDTAADSIQVAIFRGDEAVPSEEFEVRTDARGMGRLKARLGKESGSVKCVYEAGPCGYDLYRTLRANGFECDVIAPSLTPRKPGEQVKTNRLDARRLGTYYRGGHLTPVRIPDEKQEALRDLLRARDDIRRDLHQSRQRLNGLMLRRGHRYEGDHWSLKHWAWIKALRFEDENVKMVVDEYIASVEWRKKQLERFDAQIEQTAQRPEYATRVAAYSVLRGVRTLGAMTILAEGGDLRQYATAPQFMGSTGMVPRENSTGDRQRRGGITKTGNAYLRRILIEAAWAYRRRANAGPGIQKRRTNQPETLVSIAQRADLRLHRKYSKLLLRYNKKPAVAIVAVARELAGFIWAIGQQLEA